ncbi:MAG: hypothetical protein BWY81_01355 [Firmicutes bacterium ADurb.Bin467]|nr:MAG: hypothetical protein BWY81_01355 [Firmicutes bacterium ADurb.Bin467]
MGVETACGLRGLVPRPSRSLRGQYHMHPPRVAGSPRQAARQPDGSFGPGQQQRRRRARGGLRGDVHTQRDGVRAGQPRARLQLLGRRDGPEQVEVVVAHLAVLAQTEDQRIVGRELLLVQALPGRAAGEHELIGREVQPARGRRDGLRVDGRGEAAHERVDALPRVQRARNGVFHPRLRLQNRLVAVLEPAGAPGRVRCLQNVLIVALVAEHRGRHLGAVGEPDRAVVICGLDLLRPARLRLVERQPGDVDAADRRAREERLGLDRGTHPAEIRVLGKLPAAERKQRDDRREQRQRKRAPAPALDHKPPLGARRPPLLGSRLGPRLCVLAHDVLPSMRLPVLLPLYAILRPLS